MDDEEREHLEEIRRAHQDRLRPLEVQQATFGISAPPHVITEIEEIRQQIAAIDEKLNLTRTLSSDKVLLTARVFFILCGFCSEDLMNLVLEQNHRTSLFEVLDATNDWFLWDSSEQAVSELRSYNPARIEWASKPFQALEDFCDEYQRFMNQCNQDNDLKMFDGINIAVTEKPFPARAFYSWITRDRKGVVINIHPFKRLFKSDAERINKAVIRVIQRALVYGLSLPNLKVHQQTRQCLLDFTPNVRDFAHLIDDVDLCRECKRIVKKQLSEPVADAICAWLHNTF